MKWIINSALLTAVFCISVAVSGCGNKKNDPQAGGPAPGSVPAPAAPGVPGYAGGISQLPDGRIAIPFNGQNIYYSGVRIVGGVVSGRTNYAGYFSGGYYATWSFVNSYYSAGTLSISPSSMPLGQPGTMEGPSRFEQGSGITVMTTPSADPLHANVSGIVTLSQSFIQRAQSSNPPVNLSQLVGMAFDLMVSGNRIYSGGILLYTSQDQNGYHGAFLAL